MISIVITSYNRKYIICDAIDSALAFLDKNKEGEVIIVDDYSTDGTVSFLESEYANHITSGVIKIIQHDRNRGVTAAKNAGATEAKNTWLMFLDSDDQLIASSSDDVRSVLQNTLETIPAIFFRCVNEHGQPIGKTIAAPIHANLVDFFRSGVYGEFLPVLRRKYFNLIRYREELRGFEGLAYCELIKAHGSVVISPLKARVYNTAGDDRLSTRKNMLKRGCLIARGYFIMLKKFHSDLPISLIIDLIMKIGANTVRCLIGKIPFMSKAA